MFVTGTDSVQTASTEVQGPSASDTQAHSPDAEKLKKAAGDFESILLANMWKSMKQSFGTSEADSDPAHGTLDDWGIEIMSGAVGKAGGLGIGRLIMEHLTPALKTDQSAIASKSNETTAIRKNKKDLD